MAVVAAAVFVTAQQRGRHPMLPLDLFRSRVLSTTLAIAFVTMGSFYAVVFLQSLYFQQQRGASALTTGLLFLPMTATVAALNPVVARLMQRYGRVTMILTGELVMAIGLAALALVPTDMPTVLIALVMVPVGVGGSFTVPPVTAMVMDQVVAGRAGVASGVLNTSRQLGGSLGVAVFGAVLAQHDNFFTGMRLDLGFAAAAVAVLAIVTLPLRRTA